METGTAVCVVLVSVLFVEQSWCSTIVECPPWTFFNSSSGACDCGDSLYGIVRCNSDTRDVSVQDCYCMTTSEEENITLLSYCVYNCHYSYPVYYYSITRNVSELNSDTCGDFGRTGLMCSECIAGYAPPVYSYSAACVECRDYKYNWLKYIAVAYLPLTLFYILILLLRISVNSAPMVVYVMVSQIISAPGLIRWYEQPFERDSSYLFLSLHAIWNLDFFRGFYKPFCLHPDLSTLQVICLDYIVGVYPLALILVTYCLVQLHDRYVVISRLWKPFFKLISFMRKEWDIRESLVNTFATFLILTYVKMLNVSADLLAFNAASYNMDGDIENRQYLVVDNSVTFLSWEHIPYAAGAILMLTLFNILPLALLSLYPCSCFQRCLNRIGGRFQLLHVLMDTFQGSFKSKPWDCRYFPGFYLFLRMINLVILTIFNSPLCFAGMILLFLLAIVLIAVCQPYKDSKRNSIDIVLLCLSMLFLVLLFSFITCFYLVPISSNLHYNKGRSVIIVLSFGLPAYGLILVLYQVGKLLFKVLKCRPIKYFSRQQEQREPLIDNSFSSYMTNSRNQAQ